MEFEKQTMSTRRKQVFVWGIPILAVVIALASCIKREPVQDPAATDQPAASATAEQQLLPATRRPPTGLYGKVKGEDVLGGKGLRAFAVSGKAEDLDARWLPVEGMPFTEKIRAKALSPSKNSWDVQVRASNATPVKNGDVMLGTIYFRTEFVPDESGEGQTEAVFEMATDPWTKSVTYPVRASSEWKQIYVPFVAEGSYAPGEAQFAFRMGYGDQVVELGGIKLENFGGQLALADLPKTRRSYPGAEMDAPWRAEAQARIEKHRKANLKVVVNDANGTAIPDASVSVQLTRHAFGFGTAAPADLLTETEKSKFVRLIPEYFNTVTVENNLKWQPLAGDWGNSYTLERALAAVDWLNSQHIDVRGHVLVWPGWQNLPAKLKQHKDDKAYLLKAVSDHIQEVGLATKGKVVDWDVLNEPFTNHDLLDILGYEIMVDWFKQARALDPKPKLYINDFAILNGGGGTTGHRDHYEKMIRLLVDNGAPVDGIGFQGHFGSSLTGPEDLYRLLERYGQFGKRMAVTEYDILEEDEQLCADYTRDFYTLLFSHPQVDSIIMWGHWDARHWKKKSAMFDADWNLKPSGKEYIRLTQEEWNTSVSGATDAAGSYALRGFLGEYSIEVTTKDGKKKRVKTKLTKPKTEGGAQVVTVQL